MNEPIDAVQPLPPQTPGRVELEQSPERYGRVAAAGLLRLTASPVPAEFASKPVRRDEQRFASPEMMRRVWERAQAAVFDPKEKPEDQTVAVAVRADILGEDEQAVRAQIERIKEQTVRLIAQHEPKEGEVEMDYFVPYNADPTTIEISVRGEGPEEQETINYHDEAHLGVSRNSALARLATLSNFYGRLSRQPDAQRAFLKGIVDAGKSEDARAENLVLARATAAFGAIYMAKYPMREQNPRAHGEFYLAQNHLGSLAQNLASLERT